MIKKSENTYLVVGLGNPGDRYARTYHNLGYMAADAAAVRLGAKFKKQKYMSDYAEAKASVGRVFIIKPLTFMNLSGDAVKGWLSAARIPIENLLVVYDDIDIPKGALRIRDSGSAGTHNGMRNIIDRLGTDKFKRLRIGAGRPPEYLDLAEYVLSNIDTGSKELLLPAIDRAAEAIERFVIGEGIDAIGRTFNGNGA